MATFTKKKLSGSTDGMAIKVGGPATANGVTVHTCYTTVTTGSALNRLAVGGNGAILNADSTAANGVAWLAAGTAGYVLTSAGAGNALTWAEAATPSDSDQNVLAIQVFS